MIKVRIQLDQGSAADVTKNMLRNEGTWAFYKGLSAGLLRQSTFATARLGSFRVFFFFPPLYVTLTAVKEM
ncbi:hypothetical protein CDL12_21016 [Handroanthus impetiginosus]|uniref:Mitochondrial carrier protein n=1 Tax=Handroanthus impetiginosus TaxID=429701 RepID=A0A2G9GMA0_9LAMI|nr:hypothetical protein CDL12_21016 [Handroanthus impetiginosus]